MPNSRMPKRTSRSQESETYDDHEEISSEKAPTDNDNLELQGSTTTVSENTLQEFRREMDEKLQNALQEIRNLFISGQPERHNNEQTKKGNNA